MRKLSDDRSKLGSPQFETGHLKTHPFAEKFPTMNSIQLQKLADDILENGLKAPVILTPDGTTIVDGRNRLRACGVAGVEPRFRRLPKDSSEVDIARYILTMWLKKSGLTPSIRAVMGAFYIEAIREHQEIRDQAHPRERGRFVSPEGKPPVRQRNPLRNQVAIIVGAGATQVQEALRVIREAPDLAIRIRDGELTVKSAKDAMLARISPQPVQPEFEKPSKHSAPPLPSDKTRQGILARTEWIRYYAQEEKLPSHIIGKKLGIRDATIRRIAKRYGIEIPDDTWTLKRRKLNFDANRAARAVADDLVALEGSIQRLRESYQDIDDPDAEDFSRIFWNASRQLRLLAKEMYYEIHPKKRTDDDDDNAS